MFVGGAVGTGLRHLVGLLADGHPGGTLACNLLGAFALGFLLARLGRAAGARAASARLLVGTGLLGSFTTYSGLVAAIATGPVAFAWPAAVLSLGLGVPLAWAGLRIGARRA